MKEHLLCSPNPTEDTLGGVFDRIVFGYGGPGQLIGEPLSIEPGVLGLQHGERTLVVNEPGQGRDSGRDASY
jgi:hypothetical protein